MTVGLLPLRHPRQFLHPPGGDLEPVFSTGSIGDGLAPVAHLAIQSGQGVTHRRLTKAETFPGTSDAAVLHDRVENSQEI